MSSIDIAELDIRAKIVEIDRAIAQTDQARADADRKRQEIRLAPWMILLSLLTLVGASFAAGAAFFKLLQLGGSV